MHTYFFSICLIFVGGFQLSHGQDECGLNEVRAECVNPCNTCEPTGRICNLACVPGCTCKPDHARNKSGVCIPRNQCKGFQLSHGQGECGLNEVRAKCVDPCNTCESTGRICDLACVPGCTCKPDHARNKSEVCIPRNRCNDSSKDKEPDSTVSSPPEDEGGKCPDIEICNLRCQGRGLPGGTCKGPGRRICQCFGVRGNDPVDPPHFTDGESCLSRSGCDHSCIILGYSGGDCVGRGRRSCRCIGNLDNSSAGTEVDPPSDGDEAEDGGCPINRRCVRSCMNRNFSSGICVGRGRRVCRCVRYLDDGPTHQYI